jgi:hypothetical protein
LFNPTRVDGDNIWLVEKHPERAVYHGVAIFAVICGTL